MHRTRPHFCRSACSALAPAPPPACALPPTLLIVGGNDHDVIALNHKAWLELQCSKDLVIVPGAGHLFEETGGIEQVARLATDWFAAHFVRS